MKNDMKSLAAPLIPTWIEELLPPGTKRYCLNVGTQTMHVMETGEGFPVLMLHGNPTWGFLYRKIIKELAGEDLRMIFPDLIGLGFSSKPRNANEHQFENHSKWIGSLLDQLEIKELIFVGQDWGGPIGLRALADRPDLLKGLVLLNTALGPPKRNFKPTRFHRFSNIPVISDVAFRFLGFPQKKLHRVQGQPDSIRGVIAKAYRFPLHRYRDNLAPLALARMVPDSMEHQSIKPLKICQKFVESYKGPCEIVWGDSDPILGRAVKRVENLLPQAKVTRTNAGHFIQEEEPKLIANSIKEIRKKI